jgi:Uncharacterized protein conserved in bacteria
LYETDSNFQVIRKAAFSGFDFEDVCSDSTSVYICDETMRRVFVLDLYTLEQKGIKMVQYHGGRNLGYESITYNPVNKRFVMATEKDPTIINEFDANFVLQNETKFKNKGDISGLCYHNNSLYVLSDEKHLLYRVNPTSYQIEHTYNLSSILNPEGICFAPNGQLVIISDDLQKVYLYQQPQ